MRILDLRNKAGITQVELARKIGITPAYLCDLEKGKKKNPSVSVMIRLAEALNVTVNDLLDQRGNRNCYAYRMPSIKPT